MTTCDSHWQTLIILLKNVILLMTLENKKLNVGNFCNSN